MIIDEYAFKIAFLCVFVMRIISQEFKETSTKITALFDVLLIVWGCVLIYGEL